MTLKIAIVGSAGRMGHALLEAVLHSSDMKLAAALEQPGNPHLNVDAGTLVGATASGVALSANLAALAGSDVLIDFTRPAGTLAHLSACRQYGVNLVIGTTGFSDAEKKTITEVAREIAIVFAPNMSVGTNLLFKLSDLAARVLRDGYDVEIIEAHHKHKVDAPSGTALHLGDIIAKATGRTLQENAVFAAAISSANTP
jgi:4-hydroxy-tetrahydrodipicolinate reductase